MERTLPSYLAQLFKRGSHRSGAGEGNGRVIQIWTEGCSAPLQVPFTVLQGEGVEFLGRAADALIAISNYRLHIKFKDSVINVSVCLVLPQPSQNPCEVQCGIAPMLYLIRSPRSRGSLFLTNFLFSCLVLPAVGLLSQLFSLPLFSLSLILLLAFLRGIAELLEVCQLASCMSLVESSI